MAVLLAEKAHKIKQGASLVAKGTCGKICAEWIGFVVYQ